MKSKETAGIRALSLDEQALVGGGWYDDGATCVASGNDGLNGGEQYAGVLDKVVAPLMLNILSNFLYDAIKPSGESGGTFQMTPGLDAVAAGNQTA